MPNAKMLLRTEILRKLPNPEQRPVLSARICAHIQAMDRWRFSRVTGVFLPLADEVDLTSLIQDSLQQGRIMAVPAQNAGGEWEWRRLANLADVENIPSALGTRQPVKSHRVNPGTLDLVLVPARAVDRQGGRLGRGAGIMDRLLQDGPAFRMAVVFSSQVVDHVPTEEHDIPLHAFVSEDIYWEIGPRNDPG